MEVPAQQDLLANAHGAVNSLQYSFWTENVNGHAHRRGRTHHAGQVVRHNPSSDHSRWRSHRASGFLWHPPLGIHGFAGGHILAQVSQEQRIPGCVFGLSYSQGSQLPCGPKKPFTPRSRMPSNPWIGAECWMRHSDTTTPAGSLPMGVVVHLSGAMRYGSGWVKHRTLAHIVGESLVEAGHA